MKVRKVVGDISITLYENEQACLTGHLEGQPVPLSNARFFRYMLRAGANALEKHYNSTSRSRLVVPVRVKA